jgi:hypothetical protein
MESGPDFIMLASSREYVPVKGSDPVETGGIKKGRDWRVADKPSDCLIEKRLPAENVRL